MKPLKFNYIIDLFNSSDNKVDMSLYSHIIIVYTILQHLFSLTDEQVEYIQNLFLEYLDIDKVLRIVFIKYNMSEIKFSSGIKNNYAIQIRTADNKVYFDLLYKVLFETKGTMTYNITSLGKVKICF